VSSPGYRGRAKLKGNINSERVRGTLRLRMRIRELRQMLDQGALQSQGPGFVRTQLTREAAGRTGGRGAVKSTIGMPSGVKSTTTAFAAMSMPAMVPPVPAEERSRVDGAPPAGSCPPRRQV
jgi:hypothetical protein